MINQTTELDQLSGQSSTQLPFNNPLAMVQPYYPAQFHQQQAIQQMLQNQQRMGQYPVPQILSEDTQDMISALFIDLDILFLQFKVHKLTHKTLTKDKNQEAQIKITDQDIRIISKLSFAKSILKIRYKKEIADILEKCLTDILYDGLLLEKLPTLSENQQQLIKGKLNEIRQAIE